MKKRFGLLCVALSLVAMPGCIDVKTSDLEKLFKQETESADKGNEPVEAVADTIVMISEEESDHLFFKGVPIDGSLEEYVARMKYAGFEYSCEWSQVVKQSLGLVMYLVIIAYLTLSSMKAKK